MDAKADENGSDPVSDEASVDQAQPRNRRRRNRMVVAYIGVAAVIVAAMTSTWWYSCGFHGCPSVAELQAWRPTEGGALLDQEGLVMSALSPVKRVNVSITKIPRETQAAFVAVEDRRFYTHDGIDWRGLVRAMVRNVQAGGVREGASTITMQLARNVFLSHRANERSVARKLLEWRYAGLIEKALNKPEILERYLNAIYMGNGVYGVEAASQDLFGKSVSDVSLSESAMLAGLPKAPSSYSPRRDRVRARARRDVVLGVLEREGVATPVAVAAARARKISALPSAWEPSRRSDSWAVETVRAVLDSLRRIGAIPAGINDGQLLVRSTFNQKAQRAAERVVSVGASQIDAERSYGRSRDLGSASNRTQGALVAMDPSTGALRAIAGGRRVERKGFNRALSARRQAGSTFKPFVYATALQHGFTSATMLEDLPVTVGEGRNIWTPANYGDDYAGSITVRDALAQSANAATVRMSRVVGIPRIAAQARAQGLGGDLPDVPSLALGAGTVTPLELTAAYAPFGNGGVRVQPHSVLQVEDIFGRVLWTRPPANAPHVLDVRDAFLMTTLLRGVVDEGTGNAVRRAGIQGPVAGKTGTTNDGADVWFVGFTPTLVATVWFGADSPSPLGNNASGGRLAAPIWARFLREGWHSPQTDSEWPVPDGVVSASIDPNTGKLGSDWCGPSRKEWFRSGTAPTESCERDIRFAANDDPWWSQDDGGDAQQDRQRDRQRAREERGPGLAELTEAMNAAIEALETIGDRRGRDATRRVIEELRRAIDQERRRIR